MRQGMPWLVVIGVLVAATSLRGPIVAPTPVLRQIEEDLQIGAATAGLLTSAPVLMFAALTPLAALVIRRAGAELALLMSLSGVLVGTFIRALPGFTWMLIGMFVIGAFITIGNVVIPVIIRRDVPPGRVALVTAMYAATLNVGSLITSLGTAPLADLIGWHAALMAWSVLTLVGIALWGVHMHRRRGALDDDELGLSTTSAGAVASIYQGAGIAGAFLVPVLARFAPRWVAPAVICASWLAVSIGLLVAPELLWLWLSIGAIGHAGGFVVIFSSLVAVSRSDAEAAGLSAMVQGFGYAIGALGGPVMGALHEITGGWTAALVVILVFSVAYCVVLLAAVAAAARPVR
jgi:CP family cyanate transporter-like MFS transporter